MALGAGKCTNVRFPGIYIGNGLSKSANVDVPDSDKQTSILGQAIIGKMIIKEE